VAATAAGGGDDVDDGGDGGGSPQQRLCHLHLGQRGIIRLTLLTCAISVASLMRRSRSSSARAIRARSVSWDDEEEARALVKITGDALHGRHALGQQCEVRTIETDAAVVSFAQPVIERLSQAHAVTRFGPSWNCRAACGQGAIDVFG